MSYLADCKEREAQWMMKVLKQNQELKTVYRHHKNGYANKKDGKFRHILSFQPSVLFHPEWSKFFDKDMDPHERKKHMYAFARKHPEYVVVDKL